MSICISGQQVKVDNVDEFGPRSIEIKTDKMTFSTPTRAVTSTESNYKKYVRTLDDPYDNSVFEVVNHFTQEKLKMLYIKHNVFILIKIIQFYYFCCLFYNS